MAAARIGGLVVSAVLRKQNAKAIIHVTATVGLGLRSSRNRNRSRNRTRSSGSRRSSSSSSSSSSGGGRSGTYKQQLHHENTGTPVLPLDVDGYAKPTPPKRHDL